MNDQNCVYKHLHMLINDLKKMRINNPFIGYGNPDADILIIGQECAWKEGSDDYNKFYKPNFKHWEDSFENNYFSYRNGIEGEDYLYENKFFHPIFPFYLQLNTTKKNLRGHTNSTYMYYQMLIDKIRAEITGNKYVKSPHITFFRDCFITELSDICMPNHKEMFEGVNSNVDKKEIRKKISKIRKEIKEHIEERFNWMRRTHFYDQFKVVVLACGPYADAIDEDPLLKKDLFGEATVVFCNQLSRWDKKHLESDSDNKIKLIAKCLPKISDIE